MTCKIKTPTTGVNFFCPDFGFDTILSENVKIIVDVLRTREKYKKINIVTNRKINMKIGAGVEIVNIINDTPGDYECIILIDPNQHTVKNTDKIYSLYTTNPPGLNFIALPVPRPRVSHMIPSEKSFSEFTHALSDLHRLYNDYVESVMISKKYSNQLKCEMLNLCPVQYKLAIDYLNILSHTNMNIMTMPGGVSPGENLNGRLIMSNQHKNITVFNKNINMKIKPLELRVCTVKSKYYSKIFRI